MTNQATSASGQLSPHPDRAAAGLSTWAIAALVAGAVLVGCESEAEPVAQAPVARRQVAPPVLEAPAVTSIENLMVQLGIDDRVILAESDAPDNDIDRIAVLEFFDAFTRGDDRVVSTMLSVLDRVELDALVETGAWEETTKDVTEVIIKTGPSPYGDDKCALALFDVDGEIQPQLWYYTTDGDERTFDAAPTPPGIMDRIYGDNLIAQWHQILVDAIALANELDAELDRAPVNLDPGDQGSGGSSPSAAPPSNPGSPSPRGPGGPQRRKPPPKRKPPGSR